MENKKFGKWRDKLWPIYNFELKKIIPLFFMKFFISLNYGILTSLKDTVIVTQKKAGAEVIPVLKGWIVLPIAIIATICYSKLTNIFKRSSLFYGIIFTFIFLFFVYGFIIFPNQELLIPHQSANKIISLIGSKYEHLVAIYRYWMHSIFFVAAELWGSIVIFLLFWGFSNQIIHYNESKRFYTVFCAGGNLASMLTGPIVWHYAKKFIDQKFSLTVQYLMFYAIIIGIIIMLLHFFINKFVLTDKKFYDPNKIKKESEKKTSLSLIKSFKFIFKSKYLISLAAMVICYGLTINLIEVTWKANLKLQYPNPANYHAFMGTISLCVGASSFFIALFIGSSIIRFLGWKRSSLLCPILIGGSGILFLFLALNKDNLSSISTYIKISPILIITAFGAFQNVFSKALKYSIFDPTKEMAFIPLDQESKVKGKAAVDVVGSRLGKSGSSWIQILLIDLVGTGTIFSITYLLIPIVLISTLLWSFSIKNTEKESKKLGFEF